MATKKSKVQNIQAMIYGPRVTEKAAMSSGDNVYTFNVSPDASKIEIKKAIHDLYGVMPMKVNTVAVPTKKVRRGQTVGVKGGGKKALVFLKKGDSINLV
jgi:large subunit ribosomal protein L23